MLVLTRKQQEQVVIQLGNQTVQVRVLRARAGSARLAINAPEEVQIRRDPTSDMLHQRKLGPTIATSSASPCRETFALLPPAPTQTFDH